MLTRPPLQFLTPSCLAGRSRRRRRAPPRTTPPTPRPSARCRPGRTEFPVRTKTSQRHALSQPRASLLPQPPPQPTHLTFNPSIPPTVPAPQSPPATTPASAAPSPVSPPAAPAGAPAAPTPKSAGAPRARASPTSWGSRSSTAPTQPTAPVCFSSPCSYFEAGLVVPGAFHPLTLRALPAKQPLLPITIPACSKAHPLPLSPSFALAQSATRRE
jgi:hypothetical protein